MSFGIITPGRFLESNSPVGFKLKAEGYFTLEAVRSSGRVTRGLTFRDIGPFQNLILNQGLNGLATTGSAQLYGRFHLGTGTATPTVNDTQLAQPTGPILTSSDGGADAGVAPDYVSTRNIVALSSIGAFGDTNLTEIGVGGTSTSTLFSRALIVDAAGNPTAFPIQSDEQLRVTYQLRLYPPLEDAIFEVDVGGVRQVTVRPLYVNNATYWSFAPSIQSTNNFNLKNSTFQSFYTGGLSSITDAVPQGSSVPGTDNNSIAYNPYNPGSYRRSARITWASTQGNSDQMRTARVQFECCAFQVEYDPPLAKNSEQTMFLEYEIAWGRR